MRFLTDRISYSQHNDLIKKLHVLLAEFISVQSDIKGIMDTISKFPILTSEIRQGLNEIQRLIDGSIDITSLKEEIAEVKMPDLNAFKVESAMKMVAGTARSMGITVSGKAPWEV